MSFPRRLGRLARGFVSSLQEDERFKETVQTGRERGETLKNAFDAAWRGAAEEWRASEERRAAEERERRAAAGEEQDAQGTRERTWNPSWQPRKYPPSVIHAYERLGLDTGTPLEEVNRKRRELVKRYHPDKFADPEKRARAEKLTSQINASHDTIRRHLQK